MDVFRGEDQTDLLMKLMQIRIAVMNGRPNADRAPGVIDRLRDVAVRAEARAANSTNADDQAVWLEVSSKSEGFAHCIETPNACPPETYNEAVVIFDRALSEVLRLPPR
jgi:hypothetical protein